jgi:hypothetical protein
MERWEEARRRRFLAYLEGAVGALDLVAGAPPGNKGTSQRGIVEIDRDCVVHYTVQTGWRHRPAVGAAIRVQPCPYLIDALPEAAARTPAPSSPS